MRKKSILVAILAIMLVISQQAWALEMEEGGGSSRFHLHGYGELHYNNPSSESGKSDKVDLHRMVWGLSYDISDSIILHTEVDFEHAAKEMELEFAYLDFLLNPAINVRAGLMILPVGPLNEFHEPPLFYSVERPLVQKLIIPTTWQEGGVGVFGTPMEGLSYRVYLVAGLDGSRFSGENGIRKGRGGGTGGEGGHVQNGEELAVVGRLEYAPIPGLDLGFSFYEGEVNQNSDKTLIGDPSVTLYEFDGRVRMAGFDFQALYAMIEVDDADKINTFQNKINPKTNDPFGKGDVGEEMVGWHVELAYHLQEVMGTSWDLVPFVRIAQIDLQDKLSANTKINLKSDREVNTYGVAFLPHPQVAIKVDFQDFDSDAGGKTDFEQFNLGVAWMY